jgi:regulator of protease activity HflC (stomatin/prohibitin superfamily)
LTQAQRQAEIVAATVKGKGDAARAQAEGEADALRTKGEAEATYNAKVAASLTPTLIQQQYLMRWNGQLPQYMLGGDNSLLLQLPGGIQKYGLRRRARLSGDRELCKPESSARSADTGAFCRLCYAEDSSR